MLSPEPWVKRSWYCLLGKFAGKNLFIMGLGKEKKKVAEKGSSTETPPEALPSTST